MSCWQHHFLLLRSSPARQAGYAEALGFSFFRPKYQTNVPMFLAKIIL
jgi:hypothetical protein